MKAWDKSQTDPQIIYLFSFVLFRARARLWNVSATSLLTGVIDLKYRYTSYSIVIDIG